MKWPSGKLGSKASSINSDSFVDGFSESQKLRQRLHAIVHELKATLGMLEQNICKKQVVPRSRCVMQSEVISRSVISDWCPGRSGRFDIKEVVTFGLASEAALPGRRGF